MSDMNRNEKMRELLLKLSSATDEELEKLFKVLEDKKVPEKETATEKTFEENITEGFKLLGIPFHIKGYKFLKDACICINENPELIFGEVTKSVYPYVAKINGTTPSRVERAIRHAIEVAFDRGDCATQAKIFGNTYMIKGKPTNSEFMAAIVEYYK